MAMPQGLPTRPLPGHASHIRSRPPHVKGAAGTDGFWEERLSFFFTPTILKIILIPVTYESLKSTCDGNVVGKD